MGQRVNGRPALTIEALYPFIHSLIYYEFRRSHLPARSADIVIIGGGVMGVSIAHHLASAKVGQVMVLEKRFIGAGSSGKSGAIIRQHYSTRLLVQMARAGVTTFRDFEAATGSGSGWRKLCCLIVP